MVRYPSSITTVIPNKRKDEFQTKTKLCFFTAQMSIDKIRFDENKGFIIHVERTILSLCVWRAIFETSRFRQNRLLAYSNH